MIRTYRYRVKDGNNAQWLRSRAQSVNFVWNWCNDARGLAIGHNKKWRNGFDLDKLSSGCGSELGLHSQTVQAICEKYVDSRNTGNRSCLRYRRKKSRRRVPFKASGIRIRDGRVIYGKRNVRFGDSRSIPADAKILSLECPICFGALRRHADASWIKLRLRRMSAIFGIPCCVIEPRILG